MLLAAVVTTALTITVSPGAGGPTRHWTLHCGPAGGTLPRAADACTRLSRLAAPFAPVPRTMMCSAIYGGPQTARVQGTFRGHAVRTAFNRKNGCETARWQRVSFLFRQTI